MILRNNPERQKKKMATTQDTMRKNEYDVSVDDILAEYEVQQQAERERAFSVHAQSPYEDGQDEQILDDEGVKVYNPKSRSSSKADTVREYSPSEVQDNYTSPASAAAGSDSYDQYYDEEQYGEDGQYYDNEQYDEDGQYYDNAQYSEDGQYYDNEQYSEDGQYYDNEQYGEDGQYYDEEQYDEDGQYYDNEQYGEDGQYYDNEQYGEDSQYYDEEQYGEDGQYYDEEQYGEDGQYYDERFVDESSDEASESLEFDPRFNIGGKPKTTMVYGGKELDISPDENYIPPVQTDYIPVQEMPSDYNVEPSSDDSVEDEDREEKPRKKLFRKKRQKDDKKSDELQSDEPSSGYSGEGRIFNGLDSDAQDFSDSTGEYAFQRDYGAQVNHISYEDDFPSFKEYLLGVVTGVIYKLRNPGTSVADGGTVEASDEDYGPEVTPMAASKYYGSFIYSLKMRFRVSLVLMLVLIYVSLGLPLPGMLKTVPVQAAMCMALQFGIMVLSLDVVTGAVLKIFRGSFGADSLAVLMCLLTSIDAIAVSSQAFGTPHTPLCVISSLSLLGVLCSSLLSAKGLRKSLRVPAIGKTSYSVSGESGVKGDGLTLLKSGMPSKGFVRRSEEEAPDENIFRKICPFTLVLALFFTLIVCTAKKAWADFIFVFTAILAPAVPVSALLAFALPYFVGSARIFASGAAIAGWSGLSEVGSSKNLIVTDRDLFPHGSVKIQDIRIFSNASAEKIISYAGTMISASGSGIGSCFAELMEKNHCATKHVENFEYLPGGGMKGIIDGETVLCGGTELMRLMNVQLPFRLIEKCSVLLAVDGILYGIFNMSYTADDKVRRALINLMRSNRHPIFAVRDFNISPQMLHESFDLATDGYDFPPFVERFKISEAKPGVKSRIAAVVCREGLGPLIHMADTGRSMYVATRLNILITLLSVVIGIMTVFIKFLSAGYVSIGFMLVYMLLWVIPVAAISFFLKF